MWVHGAHSNSPFKLGLLGQEQFGDGLRPVLRECRLTILVPVQEMESGLKTRRAQVFDFYHECSEQECEIEIPCICLGYSGSYDRKYNPQIFQVGIVGVLVSFLWQSS